MVMGRRLTVRIRLDVDTPSTRRTHGGVVATFPDRRAEVGPPPIELLDFRVWRRLHPEVGEREARDAWGSARSAWLGAGPFSIGRVNSLYEEGWDDGDDEPDPRLALHERHLGDEHERHLGDEDDGRHDDGEA
jgi:hypothetical protein